jgi:hypothetical protein
MPALAPGRVRGALSRHLAGGAFGGRSARRGLPLGRRGGKASSAASVVDVVAILVDGSRCHRSRAEGALRSG